ncbi:Hpt domain-containing protein [Sphingomonas arantia]|uniref:Hpt domain-containing protein n=1 Tax=Sphingomonas arantia TaxID=1460676 RepID=A0ABW4U465_9SPHN
MSQLDGALVDWTAYHRAQVELGADFARILGYFREDGARSVAAIEDAMRQRSVASLVMPAHTLKADAAQLGASGLATLAEHVEETARDCLERREGCDDLLGEVVRLRPMFISTMALLNQATSSVVMRRPQGFGRKVVFGRGVPGASV